MKILAVFLIAACGGDGQSPADTAIGDDDAPQQCTPSNAAPRTIFLNRAGGAYVKTTGEDDSTMNKSVIIDMDRTLPPPTIAAESDWTDFIACVTEKYKPFNVVVTDVDPGAVDHVELVVIDTSQEIGLASGVAAVSPFKCTTGTNAPFVFERAIPFFMWSVFNMTGDRCVTAAQTIGNSFGLDHAFSCPDIMTFLGGCGPTEDKTFTDFDADCGEFEARACTCGGATKQNSFQYLSTTLGPTCL